MLAFVLNCWQFVAKEGDTVEPGTKVAVILKSGEGVSHVAPSETTSNKVASQPPTAEKISEEKPKPKAESAPAAVEKPRPPTTPPVTKSASETQLPSKERERRVSLLL